MLKASNSPRKFQAIFLLLMSTMSAVWNVEAKGQNLDSLVRHASVYSLHQLQRSSALMHDTLLYVRSTAPEGRWKPVASSDWTSGFYPGCLWKIYELTNDASMRESAERWTLGLSDQQFNTRTHDVGFIMFTSFGNAFRFVPSENYRKILLQSARSLSTRFNARVGCIRSWDRRKWPFPVIIDNMMNLELLFWAARNGGGESYYAIAKSHALKTMENHVRQDGSTFHVVSYDSASGSVLAKETHQGYSDESVWARGQAWAIYGFTVAYRETKDKRFLETAEKAADYFISRLPVDQVPYWDFMAPGIPNAPKDVSAAAIAASGLLELKTFVTEQDRKKSYLVAAENILETLCRPPYLSEGTSSDGILNHAVGNFPANTEIDVSLIYADYYFLEALGRYTRGVTQ
jgi:rhamnogalacturonyl hydrolase YesR